MDDDAAIDAVLERVIGFTLVSGCDAICTPAGVMWVMSKERLPRERYPKHEERPVFFGAILSVLLMGRAYMLEKTAAMAWNEALVQARSVNALRGYPARFEPIEWPDSVEDGYNQDGLAGAELKLPMPKELKERLDKECLPRFEAGEGMESIAESMADIYLEFMASRISQN